MVATVRVVGVEGADDRDFELLSGPDCAPADRGDERLVGMDDIGTKALHSALGGEEGARGEGYVHEGAVGGQGDRASNRRDPLGRRLMPTEPPVQEAGGQVRGGIWGEDPDGGPPALGVDW